MGIREDLLPVVDGLRSIPGSSDFGLRRFSVTIRRRVWSGAYVGDPSGTATDEDLALSPLPRVRQVFSASSLRPDQLQYILANGNKIDDRYYKIDRITPRYTNPDGSTGGYSAQQLRLAADPDLHNVESIVVLVGDDGYKRECVQTTFSEDRAFGYSMLVHESDRPRVALASIAITPSPATVVHGSQLQLTATATFADGSTSDLTPMVTWTTTNGNVATVDLLGSVTGIAAGSATIRASMTGVSGTVAVTVT